MEWSIRALAQKIKKHELSPTELVKLQFDQIEKKEPDYHCYISLQKEQALVRAKQIEQELLEGKYAESLLAGIPFAVKDNLCTKGIRTTCGSKILEQFQPIYDATAVERLQAVGAILIGKTNMDEFAMGSTTENSYFGATKNPHNIAYTPGGSSGGSAAAVAAKETVFALGTDTGGSIRQPAAFCGVTGIKPTYGTVSRYGLIAYASSFDQIGLIARTAEDCAIVLETIAGADKKDATCRKQKQLHYTENLGKPLTGIRIGIIKDYFDMGLQTEVGESIFSAAKKLQEQGAIIDEIHLPHLSYAVPTYYVLACAEASSNLSRYDGVKYGYRSENGKDLHAMYEATRTEGFGEEVKRRILLGTFVLSTGYYDDYYCQAQKIRTMLKQSCEQVLKKVDVLLAPVAPTTALPFGMNLSNPVELYQADVCTVLANLTGLPAMSVPCGVDKNGLPIGMQLIGKAWEEKTLFQVAHAYENKNGL